MPSFVAPRSDPAVTFQKFGLRSAGIWRGAETGAADNDLSEAARFRGALEELGGLYAAFGQFLMWRADLLRTDYLGRLRHIHASPPAMPASDVARILSSELGPNGEALTRTLEPEPCWNTLARCAWRARYQGRVVAVQLARDPVPDSAFESFEGGLRLIEDERAREAIRPASLAG